MSKDRPRPWHNPSPLYHYAPKWAGQFDTFEDWVNHASRALTGETGSVGQDLPSFCVDAKGRRCHVGADFMRARDQDAFPVRYFWTFEEAPIQQGTVLGASGELIAVNWTAFERLVNAARQVAFESQSTKLGVLITAEERQEIDAASEAFASVVRWEDAPDEECEAAG